MGGTKVKAKEIHIYVWMNHEGKWAARGDEIILGKPSQNGCPGWLTDGVLTMVVANIPIPKKPGWVIGKTAIREAAG